jgi:hypothetical protein
MLESAHAGTRPPVASVFSISHPNVVLGALKRSEDGRGLVVRLIELHGELSQGVEVECMGVSFTADFFPTQVKTFLIDLQSGEAKESDLLER